MRVTLLLISSFLFCISLLSQDMYYTRNATLTFNGKLNDEPLRIQTTQLTAALNYETARMIVRFPVKSLVSSVDSVDKFLRMSPLEVVFDSNLDLTHINPIDHPPLKFNLDGFIKAGNTQTYVCGNGQLHNIKNQTYSSMFSMVMELNLKDLNIVIPLSGLDDNFEVVMTNTLLLREKN